TRSRRCGCRSRPASPPAGGPARAARASASPTPAAGACPGPRRSPAPAGARCPARPRQELVQVLGELLRQPARLADGLEVLLALRGVRAALARAPPLDALGQVVRGAGQAGTRHVVHAA